MDQHDSTASPMSSSQSRFAHFSLRPQAFPDSSVFLSFVQVSEVGQRQIPILANSFPPTDAAALLRSLSSFKLGTHNVRNVLEIG